VLAALALPWFFVALSLVFRRRAPALPAPEPVPAIEAPRAEAVAIPEPEHRQPEPVAARVEPAPAPPAPAPRRLHRSPLRPSRSPRPRRRSSRRSRRRDSSTALARTRDAFVGRLGALVGARRVDGDVLEELEALLFSADLGVATAGSLLDAVRSKASGGDASQLRQVLRETMLEKLRRVEAPAPAATAKPHVVLVLGVNGSGKTTTIGKLAARYHAAGQRVVMGAGDTFRAAAIEQLEVWGARVGCEVVKGQAGGDPARSPSTP